MERRERTPKFTHTIATHVWFDYVPFTSATVAGGSEICSQNDSTWSVFVLSRSGGIAETDGGGISVFLGVSVPE